jgi:hypothetical protein
MGEDLEGKGLIVMIMEGVREVEWEIGENSFAKSISWWSEKIIIDLRTSLERSYISASSESHSSPSFQILKIS